MLCLQEVEASYNDLWYACDCVPSGITDLACTQQVGDRIRLKNKHDHDGSHRVIGTTLFSARKPFKMFGVNIRFL